MNVRKQDMDRLIENIKKASEWRSRLISANNLFHQGCQQYSAAVSQYVKIIETLLRDLFQELSNVLPPKERTNFLQLEMQVGKGKPFGNFSLGHIIDFFSKTAIFAFLNSFLGESVFDPGRLNAINNYRIDQIHYDEKITRDEVDSIRKDTTSILLKLHVIEKDPEEIMIAKKEVQVPVAKQEILESLQRLVTKIRCGLLDKAMFDLWDEIQSGDGWSAHVQAKVEIMGAYVDDESIAAVVRILEFDTPLDEPSEAYESLDRKIRNIIGDIAPETKGKLKILLFSECEGSGLEGSPYACSDEKGSLLFN